MMKVGDVRVVVSNEGRVIQTVACSCAALFGLLSEWRHASLLCAALGIVVVWAWARRQSITVSGATLVLQNYCFNLPVGSSILVELHDVTEITLYVRLPSKGTPSIVRRLYFYKGRNVVARSMNLSDGEATTLLDAIEEVCGVRPAVSRGHPYARFFATW